MNLRGLVVALASGILLAPMVAMGQSSKASDAPVEKAASVAAVVNLNTASAAQLESLPGIGARTAARIIEYRQKNGAFKKVEELMNVKGIGEKNFLKLKSRLTVAAAKD
jgi:competence protein ComEA